MTTTKSLRKVIATSLMILAGSGLIVSAATFTVTNENNSGPGSLRQAVLDSNTAAGSDTIVFDSSFNTPKTITLASGININPATGDSLTITGPGANLLTVSGNNAVQIFFISAGDTASISGMKLTLGRNNNGGAAIDNRGNLTVANAVFASNVTTNSGGAIVTQGILTVSNSAFSANSSSTGGAIAITETGMATISNSTFSDHTVNYGGAISNDGAFSVSGCTFTNNTVTSGSATGLGGGAIYSNSGTRATSVANSTFTSNAETGNSGGGGGIRNRSGAMTISNSIFTSNTSVDGGGAVANSGSLSVTSSRFTQNRTTGPNAEQVGEGSGGAILSGGYLTIADSIISENSAANHGGGISFAPNAAAAPPASITNTTISGNTANSDHSGAGDGGGISSNGTGPATITRSTISGNTTFSSGGSSGRGGGIYSLRKLTMDNCTVSGNFAGFDGGGIFDDYPGGEFSEVVIINSTIVLNQAANNGGGVRSSNSPGDAPTSLGNTIVTQNTALSGSNVFNPFGSQGFNLIGGDAMLGALADNGGPTKTHALLSGSPAIDQGKTLAAATTDQRGLQRPFDHPAIPNAAGGDGSDIGAFEDQPPNTPPGNSVIARAPANDATVTFTSVSQGGFTTFIPIASPAAAGLPPQGYTIINNAPAYDIATTAAFTPPLIVSFVVASITTPAEFARVRILHGENGQLVDRTILAPDSPAPDFGTRTVSARVNSLSPFVIALAPSVQLLNVSTRLRVQTGDNALIGGFIISGTASKRVIVRAIGPSLTAFGIPGALANPVLTLNGPAGFTAITNDNWGDTQQIEIQATLPPSHPSESAIVATLPPGAYTAVVRGQNGGTGVGLVEAYDLEPAVDAKLANISTRGFVETGENVMIGGLIAGPASSASGQMLVRAIGPSLSAFGVPGVLQDPSLELRDGNGVLIASNDDWRDTQQTVIEATQLAPSHVKEAAILAPLAPGSYTAIVRGVGDTTGVGLVEVYNLQ
jgi:hypothetical protein